MRDGEKFRLADVCDIVKGETPIKKALPGDYPLVVTAAERASHETFQLDCRAVIVPLVSSTGHGHASIKRINYQEGKFALGSILCAVIPRDEERLNPKFLHVYFSYFKDQLIVPLMKGSANVSLSIKALAELRIIVPPMKVQQRVIDLADNDALMKPLENELSHQQSLLGKLKQAILQEAIQGKLTADWRASNPDVEPAGELLERIQAEKSLLIAEKKIRKEKPLSEITPEEIPFEIPAGWEWCQFGNVQLFADSGSSPKCIERQIEGSEWGILKVSSTSGTQFKQNENKFFQASSPEKLDARVQEGDFILSRANTKELVGNSVLVEKLTKNLLLSDKTVRFNIPPNNMNSRYVNLVNKAPHVRTHFIENATGASPSMKNLSRQSINSHLFPLPPLAEQAAIVERVEALMATYRELEAEIASSRSHAADLLQAVLREAFAPDS